MPGLRSYGLPLVADREPTAFAPVRSRDVEVCVRRIAVRVRRVTDPVARRAKANAAVLHCFSRSTYLLPAICREMISIEMLLTVLRSMSVQKPRPIRTDIPEKTPSSTRGRNVLSLHRSQCERSIRDRIHASLIGRIVRFHEVPRLAERSGFDGGLRR